MSSIRKPEHYTAFRHNLKDPESISSDFIQSICQDSRGTFWIATKDAGINSFNRQTGKFVQYTYDNNDPGSLSIELTLSVYCERSGTIWVTTYTGVNKMNRTESPFTQYSGGTHNTWQSSMGGGISNLINSRDDKIWVGTDSGWELFDPKTNTFTHHEFGPYYFIGEDRSGNLWFTKDAGGIFRQESNGHLTRFFESAGKEFQQHVNCIFFSTLDKNIAWIGTLEGGIFSLDQRTNSVSLSFSARTSVKTIYEDSFGLLWAGTKDGGLLQYDPAAEKIRPVHLRYR